MQAELAEVGIDVELANEETGQFVQDWRNGNFDLFASANAGGADPDEFLYRTFHTGGSTNVFKYADATVDRDLDEARRLSDAAERKAIYDRLQIKLACSGPIAAIAYGTLFSAARAELGDMRSWRTARLSRVMPGFHLEPRRHAPCRRRLAACAERRAVDGGAKVERGGCGADAGFDAPYPDQGNASMLRRLLLPRLIDLVLVVAGVSVIVFLMIRLVPGDAVAIMLGANSEVTPKRSPSCAQGSASISLSSSKSRGPSRRFTAT